MLSCDYIEVVHFGQEKQNEIHSSPCVMWGVPGVNMCCDGWCQPCSPGQTGVHQASYHSSLCSERIPWERHSETMLTSCFSSNSHPPISASIGGSRWNNRHSNILMVIFYFLSALIKWNSSIKNNFLLLLIHVFIQLFTYIPKDSKLLILFSELHFNMSVLILLLTLFYLWPQGALPEWLPCPFHTSSFFQELDVTFWHHRKSQAHLLFALTQPWSQSLFQSAGVPFIGECPLCFLRVPQPWGSTAPLCW